MVKLLLLRLLSSHPSSKLLLQVVAKHLKSYFVTRLSMKELTVSGETKKNAPISFETKLLCNQGDNLGLEGLEQAADLLSDCLQTSVNPEVKF